MKPGDICKFFREGRMREEGWYPAESYLCRVIFITPGELYEIEPIGNPKCNLVALAFPHELTPLSPKEIARFRQNAG